VTTKRLAELYAVLAGARSLIEENEMEPAIRKALVDIGKEAATELMKCPAAEHQGLSIAAMALDWFRAQ